MNKIVLLGSTGSIGTQTLEIVRNYSEDLQVLDMESILKIPNISLQDMVVIIELQKAIKANKLFSYLGGGSDEQPSE